MTDIDALLRRAEMQQRELEINLRFQKNLELFKEYMPSIYTQYAEYQPEELRLSFDTNNHVNLVNYQLNNKPVYEGDPVDFARRQVEAFIEQPLVSSIDFDNSLSFNPRHYHANLLNDVLHCAGDFKADFDSLENIPIGLMLMTGCGLGYQIADLIEKLDIYNLHIVDPHKDSLYAALHTIDWEPILLHFKQANRNLIICTGQKPDTTMQVIKMALGQAGLHNGVYTYIYRHLNSKGELDFIELYRKKFHLSAFGLGFAEDEQTSLAHTVANLNAKIPMLNNRAVSKNHPPAFIIGNGPSLDTLKDFITANKDNAIVFSSGTSSSSLSSMGIDADIHVEQERPKATKFWIEAGTSKEFRQKTVLLALNTVHPETLALFDRSYMAVKANDLGEVIINSENKNQVYPPLNFCNPTVTNCAISYAISMGFTEIYLLGIDLGMADPEKHHSNNSIHHKVTQNPKKLDFGYTGGQYKIKGNFIDDVYTDNILDSSRINFVQLLKGQTQLTVYNPNNGAYIEGAAPTSIKNLPVPPTVENKKNFLDKLLRLKFSVMSCPPLTDSYVIKKYVEPLGILRRLLELPESINSKTELLDRMNVIYKTIELSTHQIAIANLLFRGSINSYFGLLAKYCFGSKDDATLQANYTMVRSRYQEFINKTFEMMEEGPLRLDDTVTDIKF